MRGESLGSPVAERLQVPKEVQVGNMSGILFNHLCECIASLSMTDEDKTLVAKSIIQRLERRVRYGTPFTDRY